MNQRPFSQLNEDEKREYFKNAARKSRAAKRPQTLYEQLESAMDDGRQSAVRDLVDEIYRLEKKERMEFLVDQLENPTPEQGEDIDEMCDAYLAVYEHRGPYGPGQSHDLSHLGPWDFGHMKKRLSEGRLGRLLLQRYGTDEQEWVTNRPGKQNAA